MQLETFGPGMPSESLPDRQATHQQVRRGKSSKIYTFKKVGVRHREDESFDLLGLSCLKTSCGVAEYRSAIYVAWPAAYFIPRFEIILLSCSGGVIWLVLFVRILRGNGGLSSRKQGIGQTFVLPQREFWAPESDPSNSSETSLVYS